MAVGVAEVEGRSRQGGSFSLSPLKSAAASPWAWSRSQVWDKIIKDSPS